MYWGESSLWQSTAVQVGYLDTARTIKATWHHSGMSMRNGLVSQAKVLDSLERRQKLRIGLLKIPTPVIRSGLCCCSLTFGQESPKSSSSSGSRAGWLEEARVMGFERAAAPLLPACWASTLPAAFPWDTKGAQRYLAHSPSSTKFQQLCLMKALPIS